MTQQNSPDSARPALDPEPPHRPADDREEVYFHGPPVLRAEMGKLSLWWLLGLALMAAPAVAQAMDLTMPPWAWVVFIAAGLLAVLLPVLLIRTIRYRISNYRIDYERGLLSKSIDTLELWHVEDIKFHQTLLDRILRVGDITVISHDDTTPQLVLRGMPSPRPLFETLKQRIIAVKRQRGVIKMDMPDLGHAPGQ